MNELKTRGREAPDGLLFYFHNSKDADEQSEVGHPGTRDGFLIMLQGRKLAFIPK